MDKAREQMALVAAGKGDFLPRQYASIIPFENAADAEHFMEGVLLALGEKG
jgi:hypothetical protein